MAAGRCSMAHITRLNFQRKNTDEVYIFTVCISTVIFSSYEKSSAPRFLVQTLEIYVEILTIVKHLLLTYPLHDIIYIYTYIHTHSVPIKNTDYFEQLAIRHLNCFFCDYFQESTQDSFIYPVILLNIISSVIFCMAPW